MVARPPLIVDLETAPLVNATEYLEPVTAAKNLKDPEKIKADLTAREQEQLDKCGLDWNTARIVALGLWVDDAVVVVLAKDEVEERGALQAFWIMSRQRDLIGFKLRTFDYPMLVQRSRYLGVSIEPRVLNRYAVSGPTVDLYDLLTFGDTQYTFAMRRTLKAFAKRFGVPCTDEADGADIARLVAAGDWAAVAAHCESDVRLTLALAQKLGVIETPAEVL